MLHIAEAIRLFATQVKDATKTASAFHKAMGQVASSFTYAPESEADFLRRKVREARGEAEPGGPRRKGLTPIDTGSLRMSCQPNPIVGFVTSVDEDTVSVRIKVAVAGGERTIEEMRKLAEKPEVSEP